MNKKFNIINKNKERNSMAGNILKILFLFVMVGISGVEPERPKAPDFESGASTNSAISPNFKKTTLIDNNIASNKSLN